MWDGGYYTTVSITFYEEDVEYLRQKFSIETKEELVDAVWRCIDAYMVS